MDLMNKATVHASEVISARDTIQTPYSEFNVGADLPKISEADLAKLAKRAEKEEKQRRIALAQHQVCSALNRRPRRLLFAILMYCLVSNRRLLLKNLQ